MRQIDSVFEGFPSTDVGYKVSNRNVEIELNAIQVSTNSAE